MAITFGTATSGRSTVSGGTNNSVTLPAGIGSTDLIIAALYYTDINATITWPAGWTKLITDLNSGSNAMMSIAYKKASGTESSTTIQVVTSNGFASWYSAQVIHGADTTTTPAISLVTGIDPPSVTPAWGSADNGSYLFAGWSNTGSVGSYPTGYTGTGTISGVAGATTFRLSWASRVYTGSTENPSAFVASGTATGPVTATILFKPATPPANPAVIAGTLRHITAAGAAVIKNAAHVVGTLKHVSAVGAVVLGDKAVIAGTLRHISSAGAIAIEDDGTFAGFLGHIAAHGSGTIGNVLVGAGTLGHVSGSIVADSFNAAAISGMLGALVGEGEIDSGSGSNDAVISGALGSISSTGAIVIDNAAEITGMLGNVSAAGVIGVLTVDATIAGMLGHVGSFGAIAIDNGADAAGFLGHIGVTGSIAITDEATIAGVLGRITSDGEITADTTNHLFGSVTLRHIMSAGDIVVPTPVVATVAGMLKRITSRGAIHDIPSGRWPDELVAELAKNPSTLCRIFEITPIGGSTIRFTDNDLPVISGGHTFLPNNSFQPSAIQNQIGGANANLEIGCLLGAEGFSYNDCMRALPAGARVEIWLISWGNPDAGVGPLFLGTVSSIAVASKLFATLSCAGGTGFMTKLITELYSPTCRADLGDARCGLDLDAFSAVFEVATVGDDMTFNIGALDAGKYNLGSLLWGTGANAGQSQEVAYSEADGTVHLFYPARFVMTPGDTGTIYQGCAKTTAACDGYNNRVNFRGEADIPGDVPISG